MLFVYKNYSNEVLMDLTLNVLDFIMLIAHGAHSDSLRQTEILIVIQLHALPKHSTRPLKSVSGFKSHMGIITYCSISLYFTADDEGILKQKLVFRRERQNWAYTINVFAHIAITLFSDHDREF